jgi:hypothetical protein
LRREVASNQRVSQCPPIKIIAFASAFEGVDSCSGNRMLETQSTRKAVTRAAKNRTDSALLKAILRGLSGQFMHPLSIDRHGAFGRYSPVYSFSPMLVGCLFWSIGRVGGAEAMARNRMIISTIIIWQRQISILSKICKSDRRQT